VSSALIVSRRIRDSAKATSSGIPGSGDGTPSACQVFIQGIDHRGVVWGWWKKENIGFTANFDDVWRVTASPSVW